MKVTYSVPRPLSYMPGSVHRQVKGYWLPFCNELSEECRESRNVPFAWSYRENILNFRSYLFFHRGSQAFQETIFNSRGFWSWRTAMLTSRSGEQWFSTTIGETRLSLTFSLFSCWLFLLLWLLVVDMMGEEIDFEFLFWTVFSTKLIIEMRNWNIVVQLIFTGEKTESLNLQNASYLYPPNIIWSRLYS